jgi:uncharacterized protein YndB with AHSA1/START domain
VIETTHQPTPAEPGYGLTAERTMPLAPDVLYRAWTEQWDRWFAAPGSVLMTATIDVPFYFFTEFGGRRHPHYGRFLRLDPGRLVELAWVTGDGGTEGVETVVTVELSPAGAGTHVRLSHEGFPHERARDGHAQAWPAVLAQQEGRLTAAPD